MGFSNRQAEDVVDVVAPCTGAPNARCDADERNGVVLEAGLRKLPHATFNRPRAATDVQVHSKSVVGSSAVRIRACHNPEEEHSEWDATRDRYLCKKDQQLSAHLNQAVKSLSQLLEELADLVDALDATQSMDCIYHLSEHMYRTNALINKVASSIKYPGFPQRRAGYLRHVDIPLVFDEDDYEGLEPLGAEGSVCERAEMIEMWIEDAQKIMRENIKEMLSGTRHLGQLTDMVADASAREPPSPLPRPDPFLVRTADVGACMNLATMVYSLEQEIRTIKGGEGSSEAPGALQPFSQPPVGWALLRDHPIYCVKGIIDTSVDSFNVIRAVAQCLSPVVCAKYTPIIKEGTVGMSMYFIKEGQTSIQVNGREINKRHQGEFFGEMALTTNAQRKADVWAVDDDIELFELTREAFLSVCDEYPVIMDRVSTVGQQRASSHGWGFKRGGRHRPKAAKRKMQKQDEEARIERLDSGGARSSGDEEGNDKRSRDGVEEVMEQRVSSGASAASSSEGIRSPALRSVDARAGSDASSMASLETLVSGSGSKSSSFALQGLGNRPMSLDMENLQEEGGIYQEARAQVLARSASPVDDDCDWSPPPSDWGRAFEVAGWGEVCHELPPPSVFLPEADSAIRLAASKVLEEQDSFGSSGLMHVGEIAAEALAEELMLAMSRLFRRQRLTKGDKVAEAGAYGGCMWLVEEGAVERMTPGGKRFEHGRGFLLGTVVAFVCGTWPHTVQVSSDKASLLAINLEDLHSLLLTNKLFTPILTEVGKMQLSNPWHKKTVPSVDEARRRLSGGNVGLGEGN